MMQKIFFVLAFLCSISNAKSQEQKRLTTNKTRLLKVKNLTVGDAVPDILIPEIVNDKKRSRKISEYNDKLLILDFWSVHCSGCVAALPRMQALQNQIGNSVCILPVTSEDAAEVNRFLDKNSHTRNLHIISAVNDKILSKWFKFYGFPHEVWIYRDTVVALTDQDYVTASNIQFILSGKKNDWPVKNDFLPAFDPKKPLLIPDSLQYPNYRGSLMYKAILTYREGAGVLQGTVYDSAKHLRRNYFVNNTILDAYLLNWAQLRSDSSKKIFPDPNRILLEVKDPSLYASVRESGQFIAVWKRGHLICYESLFPDSPEQTVQDESELIIKDLDELLGLHGRYEKRKTNCLVLVKNTIEDKVKSINEERVIDLESKVKKFRNVQLEELIRLLNQQKNNPPVFDESHYSNAVDMDIATDSWTDIAAIRKALQGYGFDLKTEEREVEFFVLTQTK